MRHGAGVAACVCHEWHVLLAMCTPSNSRPTLSLTSLPRALFVLQGASRKKSEICASIGAHVLIDDNPSYAIDCASNGIQVRATARCLAH